MCELTVELYEYEKELERMEPIISKLTYSQHMRLNDAGPDRSIGIQAANNYLNGKMTNLNKSIAIPAIGLVIIAILVAVVAWAIR